jgi:hypothetical protein
MKKMGSINKILCVYLFSLVMYNNITFDPL